MTRARFYVPIKFIIIDEHLP